MQVCRSRLLLLLRLLLLGIVVLRHLLLVLVRVLLVHGYWLPDVADTTRWDVAWDGDGRFRASMYMRPLAIWAIEFALRGRG